MKERERNKKKRTRILRYLPKKHTLTEEIRRQRMSTNKHMGTNWISSVFFSLLYFSKGRMFGYLFNKNLFEQKIFLVRYPLTLYYRHRFFNHRIIASIFLVFTFGLILRICCECFHQIEFHSN